MGRAIPYLGSKPRLHRGDALRSAAIALAGMLVVTVLATLAQSASAQREPLSPPVTLKVGAVGVLSDAGIYVALYVAEQLGRR